MITRMFAFIALLLLGTALVAYGADKPAQKKGPATTQSAKPAVNKMCAVHGGDHTVDPDFYVNYKGNKIGFCCEDCIADFKKDPAKYAASAK